MSLGTPNAERDNPLLLWEHQGLDVEQVAALPPEQRSTVVWEHSTRHLYSRIPHYAELLRAAGDPTWRDLGAVPTFDQTLDWAGGGLLVDGARSDALYFSGGTTNRHKVLHSDLREDAYLNAVRALQYAKTPRPYRAIALRPIDVTHGAPAPIPELHRHATIAFPLHSDADYAEAAHLLLDNGSGNAEQQVVSVRSQTPTVLGLTAYLIEQGVDPAQLAVESVLHGGFHLSASWRRKLQDYWGCHITDMYGCTEFYQSYGMRCPHCGAYHFNWTILVEVTDPAGRPVDRGVGELTLTHLAPFALRQPLLRYRTGDLTEIDGVCEVTGRDRYLFGGRLRDAVRLAPASAAVERGIDRLYLTSLQIKDAVDTLPFVAHEPDEQHENGVYRADDCTQPILDWESSTGEDGVLRIDFLLGLHAEHRDRETDFEHFEALARKEIVAASAPLAELVAAGRAVVSCSMVAPEVLDTTARAI
ncbi:phenylacetate--CoA ligase [Solihabitans fulvus]|uniref:Phenylacetate--CoA ligase n=1 Tax=Solihabitans fulvus TaxID=1892852 RepID=A0A5B2WJZ4_9PSEU|nr:phenylacetate--CoA ligase [Solihabitans fulvus]KAA2252181.1 phenylacetate--CoA ligase [Solihabitans fulvus]